MTVFERLGPEECVTALSGFGASAPIAMLTHRLVLDGVIESTAGLYIGTILAATVVMYLVTKAVHRNIVWEGETHG